LHPFHEGVPDVARSVMHRIQIKGAQRLRACYVCEDQELDALGMAAENREVEAVGAILDTQWQRPPRVRPNFPR
jgi:hypothetical protein